MFSTQDKRIIQNHEQFIGSDGTTYPPQFQKDGIAELTRVIETPKPTDVVVTGFTIDDSFTQVWQFREKNSDEIAAELQSAKNTKKAQINEQRDFAKNKDILHRVNNEDHYFDRSILTNLAWLNNASSDSTAIWTTKANAEVLLTKVDFVSICAHISQRDTLETRQARRRKDAVDAFTSISEVEAYDITTVYEL